MLDLVHQSISTPQTAYEISFGDALEALLKQRIHDLPGLVTGLNAAGFAPPYPHQVTLERAAKAPPKPKAVKPAAPSRVRKTPISDAPSQS